MGNLLADGFNQFDFSNAKDVEYKIFWNGGTRRILKEMKIRRIVTGHDENGKSMVKWDTEIESQPGRPGFENIPLWATDTLPARLTEEDPNDWELGVSLENGSVLRMARYEPGVAGRWHRTDTIDYGIVLSGELWMELDKEEVHLKPGNVVIQRGTIHNWQNRGTEPCIVAFILLATEGAKASGWNE
jgi:quercetin dioxygenase-like cupin family protein